MEAGWLWVVGVLIAVFRALQDYYKIEVENEPFTRGDYYARTFWTGLIMVIFMLMAYAINPHRPMLLNLAPLIGAYQLVFDYVLNIFRGLPPWYISPNPNHPSLWERFYQNNTPLTLFFFKIWVAVVCWLVFYQYENL